MNFRFINNRPISSYLTVYSPQLHSLFSIFHRISGIILLFIFVYNFILIKIFLNIYFFTYFINIYILINSFLIFYIMIFFISYHIFNGIRLTLLSFLILK